MHSEVVRGALLGRFGSHTIAREKFIIEMDWLSPNGEMIDCAQQLVRIRTIGGGELVIQGERPQHGPALCSAVRARRYLQQGCAGYVAYVLDT